MNFRIFISILLYFTSSHIFADVYEDYISKFSHLAIRQQREFGIPASITLAQGLLESAAGRSTLAVLGNNHFGIKCHKDWNGDTILRDDDQPNECFRVYSTPEESYLDHSKFLQRSRYQSLFELEIKDYKGWAYGLKKCGYATSPTYAEKLISIIERYSLYLYDSPEDFKEDQNVAFIHQSLRSTHPIRKIHGLHYVVAFPEDTYAGIAKEFGLTEKDLQEYNDAGKNKKITEWEEVYLQPKNDSPPPEISSATIGEGENMRNISQSYGMKLSTIKHLNKKAKDRPGTILRLKP